MKNIVICCDGTRGKYEAEDKNTNVVRLFERLGKDGKGEGDEREQISYYDPGVGTYSPLNSELGRKVGNLAVSASGTSVTGVGVRGNVVEAYRYLMDCYEPGDEVYLFGYSRGAHTVRVLAGILHRCGLLTKGSENLIPYMTHVYDERKHNDIAAGFKGTFSRQCKPHFIGVWDTVASVGWLRRAQFSDNRLNGDVTYGYQALSVDENREHFRPSVWEEDAMPEGQTIEQVWFPGCHADVGGQEADRGISDIPLEWMLRNAKQKGLRLRRDWRASLRPDPTGDITPNGSYWRLLGGMADRLIPEGAKIHQSVLDRLSNSENNYHPTNLPKSYSTSTIEESS